VDIHQNNQEKEVHGKKQAPEALKE